MQIWKLKLEGEVIVDEVGIIGECLSLTTRLIFVLKLTRLFSHLSMRQQRSKRVYPVWLNSLKKFFRANLLRRGHLYT